MIKKIFSLLVLIIACVCLYASTKPDYFTYQKEGIFSATPDKVFPYLNSFKLGNEWIPFGEEDPNMIKEYSGSDSGVGAKHHFSGNNEVGEGNLEILEVIPNQQVKINLSMLRPMAGENLVTYKLEPIDSSKTKFIWSIEGNQPFIGKVFSIFIDCEKMMGGKFEKGISNLKKIVEKS